MLHNEDVFLLHFRYMKVPASDKHFGKVLLTCAINMAKKKF